METVSQVKKTKKRNIIVVKSEELSNYSNERYIILDQETGEILDDAQGYGYKSIRNAYACWTYKMYNFKKGNGV